MKDLTALNQFGFLSVTGKDATKFLQGYTTCDLAILEPDESVPGAICNIKGRMLANFRVVTIDNGFLLRLTRSLIPEVEAFLKKYIVFSKAETANLSDTYHCYGLIGSMATYPQNLNGFAYADESFVICVDNAHADDQEMRWEIWSSSEKAATADQSAWQIAEIFSGYAWIDERSKEEYIPQMLNLHDIGGVNFDKGCYLGQEIIARMQYRGNLKKRLHRGHADQEVNIGDAIFNQQKKSIGTVVTSQKQDFLAVIQTKSADESGYLLADGSNISVEDLSPES